jgi:hypothetical protein
MLAQAGRATRAQPGRWRSTIFAFGLVIAACSPAARPDAGSAPAATAASGVSGSWSRHDLEIDGPQFTSFLVGGPGFMAASAAMAQPVQFWTSLDGLTWSPTTKASNPGRIAAFAAGGPGFVAVGSSCCELASVWTSTDGVTWSAVPYTNEFGGADVKGTAQMSSVVAGGPGFVAVGVEQGGGGQTGQQGAVWTSVDGIAWRKTTVPEPGDWMHDVVVGGPGLVAVGTAQPGPGDQEKAAVWTSIDGVIWSRVADGPQFANGAIAAIVNGPKGLLAVGQTLDPRTGALHPATWTSPDGVTWSTDLAGTEPPQTGPPQAFEGSAIADVTRVSDGWLAVGVDVHMRSDGASQSIAIWYSSDGGSWTRIPDQPAFLGGLSSSLEFGAGFVAERNDEVIVIGRTAGPRMSVWFSPARPGGTVPAALPSAPPPGVETPSIQATPAPEATDAVHIDAFRDLHCGVENALYGAVGDSLGNRGPEATAFLAALDARDPKEILSTAPAVRHWLLIAMDLLASPDPWPPGADWVASEELLVRALLTNLDRIESEAAAGRAPANGSSAFMGDAESEYSLAALKALPEIAQPSDGILDCTR